MKTISKRHPATRTLLAAVLLATSTGFASAATVTYEIDPNHTYPSFEADHMGISFWRGKFNKTTGKVLLDKTASNGTVDLTIDIASVDFGLDALNAEAAKPELFDTTKYPQATYRGKLEGFEKGAPTRVVGNLTLHGVTKPVELKINRFKCMPHPLYKRELCGADATATFNRDDFGLSAGKDYGFDMKVTLNIQVEAIAAEKQQ